MTAARNSRLLDSLFVSLVLVGFFLSTAGTVHAQGQKLFCLTILHNNDAESQLINAGSDLEDFGGAARFVTVVKQQRRDAKRNACSGAEFGAVQVKRAVVTVSSGDNFLAGPEFSASLKKGKKYFDGKVVKFIKYDALALGNHEFDFGPDVLAEFIRSSGKRSRFLSANLDFSQEPELQSLANRGRIAKSVVVRKKGQKIGIVGATTEDLPFISSPRHVVVNEVAPAVQAEIDRLIQQGVRIIIFISHLQSVYEDRELLEMLTGVDVAIAGGGDEVLANAEDNLVPGDDIFGPYPLIATDADNKEIPVVTTAGNFKYLGRLEVLFDGDGNVATWTGGPIRVTGDSNPDAVKPNRKTEKKVVDPVEEDLAALAANVIGQSEVGLDGRRSQVRTVETNLGNLIADALLWQAVELAPDFGAPTPDVALQNGGGIRNDDIRGPGDITELDTFDIVPFASFTTIVPDIPRDQFKEILENAVSAVEDTAGRFAQVAGFTFTYDLAGTPQVLNSDGTVQIAGTRVVDVMLDDGTVIVMNGVVQAGAALNVATIDFLASGGDQYPFRGAPFTSVGVTYQQALRNYIEQGLSGSITASAYPEGGEGRITELL